MIELTPESAVTIAFEGELETQNWEQFRDAIVDAAVHGTSTVVLDLADVTFFNSSAIRALLGARLELEPRHVVIAIGPCSTIVQRVLDVTGLSELFQPKAT
jgi:anti-anti-sigma factor